MMESTFVYSVAAMAVYGLWGFFQKLAVQHIPASSALVWQVAGTLPVGLAVLASLGFRPASEPRGVLYAVMAGAAGLLGTLFFLKAAKFGRISVVISLTGLYPLVTILLAFVLLREPLSVKQGLGMFLALLAILLLSS